MRQRHADHLFRLRPYTQVAVVQDVLSWFPPRFRTLLLRRQLRGLRAHIFSNHYTLSTIR